MTISENFKRFQYFNFEKKLLTFPKTGELFFSWMHKDWKRNISTQKCHIRSQCYDKQNGDYKMDPLQRTEFWASRCFILMKILFQLKNLF